MNPFARTPSTFRRLLRQATNPQRQVVTTRDIMARLHARCPWLRKVSIDARPGTVRATLEVRWYVFLGLGLWHRVIRRRAQDVMDAAVVSDFVGVVRFGRASAR